jgi:hypothetical protein
MSKILIFKALIVLAYVLVLVFNYLANALPLNNRTTGAISDAYPSLFTPAGFTFSIWGLIYILVGIFVFQAIATSSETYFINYPIRLQVLFVVTCLANILWLLAWHYDKIGVSLILMILFMLTLLTIVFYSKHLTDFTKITFSVYAGWIAIALIANVTIFLVKMNLPLFQNHAIFWYIAIMIIGVIIGLLVMILTKNLVFVAVFIWAYFGIYMKHLQQVGTHLPESYNTFNFVLWMILILGWVVVWVTNHYKIIH